MIEEACFYCDDTGYIAVDRIRTAPGQENALGMCPNCEIGQAAIKGYREGISIQLDDLASYIVLCSDLKIENEKLREELEEQGREHPFISGWTCPECDRVYSPFQMACGFCGPTIYTTTDVSGRRMK